MEEALVLFLSGVGIFIGIDRVASIIRSFKRY